MALKLFEFLANNTGVEWSQTMTGVEGDKGLNFLTSGHASYTEPGVVDLINGQLRNGYTIRGHIHNHPSNTPYPSGLNDGTGDIGFARSVTDWYTGKYPGRATPYFKIYTPGDGQYINYNQNSTTSDFFSIELDEVIIRN